MHSFRSHLWVGLVLFFQSQLLFHTATAQQNFFKFPIQSEGVYSISLNEINTLGFSSVEEVSIYGNHGMLPQKIDSTIFELQEIPSKISGDQILFYASGPHVVSLLEDNFQYSHHHYSDTLFYIIGPKSKGKSIGPEQASVTSGIEASLYRVWSKKWENINLLNSGRQWYSNPIPNNGQLEFHVEIPTGNLENAFFQAKVMAQSFTSSAFAFSNGSQNLGSIDLPAIPNTTYGIKGREEVFSGMLTNPGGNTTIRSTYSTGDANGSGYVDYMLLAVPYPVNRLSEGVYFNLTEKAIINYSGELELWKKSNSGNISQIKNQGNLEKGDLLIVFNPSSTSTISDFKRIDISARTQSISSPLVIISSPLLLNQARRLAAHKQGMGINTTVLTPEEIFDAFGYGNKDVSAIRNYLAFHFHNSSSLKNVLLFGKGTFDFKSKLGGRPNLVYTYTSRNSLNPLTTYSSDDFFGFLELGKGEWIENAEGDEVMDIGVGRIPAITPAEARIAVDKIIKYETPGNIPGNWKRNLAFLADDGDNNIHLNDAESHAQHIQENFPEFEIRKLYLDRFEQVRTAGIQTSPAAREALRTNLDEGLLILNYIGHGNETTLTAERVFTVSDLADFPDNPYLPLFVTATCEFGRQDSPFIRSGAEELLLAENKGAIALLTTGRPVFSSVNFRLNSAFIANVFQRENGEIRNLGSIFKETKNNSLNGPFNRNFSLIGDPSLKLAVPELQTQIGKILRIDTEMETDTLKAQKAIRIKGEIKDPISGSLMANMNGTFEINIFDKSQLQKTLGDESSPVEFKELTSIVFQGKGEVKNGEFESEAFIPSQIDYADGTGTIRFFATLQDGKEEAFGAQNIPIGGSVENPPNDSEGPIIRVLFGENQEAQPDPINSSSIPIYISLEDQSGINISSAGIGQDITLTVNEESPKVLNRFYSALEGSFKKGQVITQIRDLQEGENQISITAWDNVGNASTFETILKVNGISNIRILESTTYPNPANRKSSFRISHNRPGENMRLSLRIFSVLGSEIYSITRRYVEASPVLEDLEWIFFHDKTNYPIKGTYIYELSLDSEKDGTSDRKSGKIIIQ
ncbi:type IX secretion system sortase PorU [Arthrospiribacter ruber]|nr:type IX secretion system sortase PorU [Arthrospiribacter ruber]